MAGLQTTLAFVGEATGPTEPETLVCKECRKAKPFGVFEPRINDLGRLSHLDRCRSCRQTAAKTDKRKTGNAKRKLVAEQTGADATLSPKWCPKCEQVKLPSEFYGNKSNRTSLSAYCIPCTNEINKASSRRSDEKLRAENPKALWARRVHPVRRTSAKEKGVPFSITQKDMTDIAVDVCPILGITLRYGGGVGRGARQDSPSLDRVVPEDGYVKDNIHVVSHKANTMKSNGTPVEHAKVVAWCFRHASTSPEDRAEMAAILRAVLEEPTTG